MPQSPSTQKDANSEFSPFGQAVLWALEHFKDEAELGARSPLATPYLLGNHLQVAGMATPEERGRALQNVLRQAAEGIRGADDKLLRNILELYYFQARSTTATVSRLPVGRTAFFKYRKYAIYALEETLIKELQPAIRLEKPVETRTQLWGRERQQRQCRAALKNGQTVSILGSGGVGKTTLGSLLAHQWPDGRGFWYTIRPGLNDRLESLVFGLGYFLHSLGASTLWQEVMADPAQLESSQALNILRYELAALARKDVTPLLCFDEVDLLQSADDGEHTRLLRFIEGLKGLAPLLIMGQQPVIEADLFCELHGLTLADSIELLQRAGVELPLDGYKRIVRDTHGAPRLLEIVSALHQSGVAVTALLAEMGDEQPLEFLLSRVLQRLTLPARSLLAELSIYRAPAPADIFAGPKRAAILQHLRDYRLVQTYGQAEVGLLPAYREIIYRTLTDDKRALFHDRAAEICAERALYTSAAYHLIAAARPEAAILLWREHQQTEISSGNAGAALDMFRELIHQPLAHGLKETLRLLCAQLERLTGQSGQAIDDLHAMLRDVTILGIEADGLEGIVRNDSGDFSEAEMLFQRMLAQGEKLVGKHLIYGHKGLGWRYMREQDFERAWREAQLASYEAENFQGFVQDLRSNYGESEQHYRAALDLAEKLNHMEGVAKTCNNLSALYSRLGRFDEARVAQQRADEHAQQIGKLMDVISAKINWAFLHNLANEFNRAIAALQAALTEFARFDIKLETWQDALINQALAEAYLGLGNLGQAEQHVRNAIELEEADVLPDSLRTFGEISYHQGDLRTAEQFIRQSIEMAENSGDQYLGGYGWRALAQVYQSQGKVEAAREAISKAIELFAQINLKNEVEKTQNLL